MEYMHQMEMFKRTGISYIFVELKCCRHVKVSF